MVCGAPAWAETGSVQEGLKTHAYSLKFQRTEDALSLIRPLLSPQGTVEEQPGGNTLVLRDTPAVLERLIPVLRAFDKAPRDVRLTIQVVKAGPQRALVSPPDSPSSKLNAALPPELIDRLRGLLRYDEYEVLAEARLTSKEGEDVTYSLGGSYNMSFRLGNVFEDKRLKLDGFRISKQVQSPTNKGRQLPPRDLFHASLNLRLDRLFTLVLAEPSATDGAKQDEALMVAITCRFEEDTEP